MKVLLIGIYALGAQALAGLLRRGFEIVGVVSKPDQGPGQCALLDLVRQTQLPLLTPENPRDPSFLSSVESLSPDLIVVAGYHLRIPDRILSLPRLGVLNVHLSLLPRHRGPCPWKWAILRGETQTGVTVHVMTPRFDQGAILAQKECPISDEETGESLFLRLSTLGAELLPDVLDQIRAGASSRTPQDESRASYDSALTDDDARIRWQRSATEIRDQIRGLHPRPGAWTTWDGTRIRILRASLGGPSVSEDPPGTILHSNGTLAIVTGNGTLNVQEWRNDLLDQSSSTSPVSSNVLV